MKTPKVPTYEEKHRYLDIACASKRGDLSSVYDHDKSRFVNYMHKKYPEWVHCIEKKVWNDTMPFGSVARVPEKDCNNVEVLKGLFHTTKLAGDPK